MIDRRRVLAGGSALAAWLGLARSGWANKAAVEIEAPESAEKGAEITVKLLVSHRGNSPSHHTDWAYLKVNGEEVKRWEYTKTSLPESEDFTVEHVIKVEGPVKLAAEAHCNIHGSAGTTEREVKAA